MEHIDYFTEREMEILNNPTYASSARLRAVLLNFYNIYDYSVVDIRNCIYSGDEEHRALFFKLFKMPLRYIDSKQFENDFNICNETKNKRDEY